MMPERIPNSQIDLSIGKTLERAASLLEGRGFRTPSLDAEVLLSEALGKTRSELYAHRDLQLSSHETALFERLISLRLNRMPVAYITGKKEFMSLLFRVNPSVLIPRPETETLVEGTLSIVRELSLRAPLLLDLGTGCGAIATSLANYLPDARITAVDISEEALKTARLNAEFHEVQGRITFLKSDLFSALPADSLPFDGIISNPPYVPDEEWERLEDNVRLFEPEIALRAGRDGMDFYRRILFENAPHLSEGGFLVFEMGLNQENGLRKLFEETGAFREIRVLNDLSGRARVIAGIGRR